MDEDIQKAICEISRRHREIIDDWCKAYLAQLYEEGIDIKPGCFTLNEQHMDSVGGSVLGKRYWFEKGIPKYPDRIDWISVKDRLPEDGEDVLVYHADDFHITVGYFESDNVRYYIESDGSKFYTDSGWETEIPWAQRGGVTHWMPLPAPPRDEQ